MGFFGLDKRNKCARQEIVGLRVYARAEGFRTRPSLASQTLATDGAAPVRHEQTLNELNPDALPKEVLVGLGWGVKSEPIVIVGHQPWIGECIHWLSMDASAPLPVRKGAAWWLQSRERDGVNDVIIRAVATLELL